MIKKLIDPELLADLELNIDFDMWADLPTTRLGFKAMLEERAAGFIPLDHVPYKDLNIPGYQDDPDVRVRVYHPTNISNPAPALLWLHGGGFVIGSIDPEVPIMQLMADGIGCAIVAVEYRLAPEHPFPAPLHDCYAALNWMIENAAELNIDANRIALSGISAGAGLAAALALMVKEKSDINLVFQLLLCPMLDDRNEEASTHLPLTGIAWDRDSNARGWAAYLGEANPDTLPNYAIPARAKDLSDLPPAYIAVGSVDLFLDENMTYARRLIEAGVSTELHVFPGGTHAFEFKVPSAKISRRAHYLNFDILKNAFSIAGA